MLIIVRSLYGTNKGVYVDWTTTTNTTNYSIIFEKSDINGNYYTSDIVTWARRQTYYDLEVGNYRMYIQSINRNVTLSKGSHPSTNSDYYYFMVTDKEPYIQLSSINSSFVVGDGAPVEVMFCVKWDNIESYTLTVYKDDECKYVETV